MADDDDLARIRQGAAVWSDWLAQNPKRRADLSGAYLSRVNLHSADLHSADLHSADLSGANLREANLYSANLSGANLGDADLREADLRRANLREANLHWANLREANLCSANLSGANLHSAYLREANLSGANLSGANLHSAYLWETVFGNVDLRTTSGLDACTHIRPSIIDHRTLQQSGYLPLVFLRGCGLTDRLIEYLPSLLEGAIQYYSCFISYSSKDQSLAARLYNDLQDAGVRCWFAPHDLPIGEKTWDAIDTAIRVRDKLLLILSKNAIASDWVEDEVSKAVSEERRRGQLVLFPVRIDDTVMKTDEPWAVKLRDQRQIGDFRQWEDNAAYQRAFDRVLHDLKQTLR